jgi:hypothetical protein
MIIVIMALPEPVRPLEEPTDAIVIDVSVAPAATVRQIINEISPVRAKAS